MFDVMARDTMCAQVTSSSNAILIWLEKRREAINTRLRVIRDNRGDDARYPSRLSDDLAWEAA